MAPLKHPPLMQVIADLPPHTEETWQWSDRSSLTNCLIALLEKALPDERQVILSDLNDHFAS